MNEYLIGLMYHYPKEYDLWKKGIVEDYEASTGLFVNATSVTEALEWSRVVAKELLNYVNECDDLTLEKFHHDCWHIPNPQEDAWSHCLSFFQHVSVGKMPVLKNMTSGAFEKWMEDKSKDKIIHL